MKGATVKERADTQGSLSIAGVGILVLRYLGTLMMWPLVGLSIAVLVTLLGQDRYTAESSFSSGSRHGSSLQISRIASQIGVSVPTGDTETSPEFYVDLIRSPHILRRVLKSNFVYEERESLPTGAEIKARKSQLLDLLVPEDGRPSLRLEWGVERLRRRISVRSDPQTGVVTVEVTLKDPRLAHLVVERVVQLVNEFNVNQRQSQAAAERRFVGQQLEEAKSELRAAEDSLSTFLEQNRAYGNSPSLVFKKQRLQRRVDRAQQLVASLERSLEEAKIREVGNTPVITVISSSTVPAAPDSRQLYLKALVGLLLGGGAAVAIVIGKEAVRRERQAESKLWNQLLNEWQGLKKGIL